MIDNLLSFASVMKSIGGVLLAVLILLAMITVHEFGHYVAGKILNFKINEFSIGFGPAIFKRRSKKTGELFAIRVIPLGGYCAFDGEDGLEEEQKEETVQPPLFEEVTPQSIEKEENDGGRYETKEESKYPEPKGEQFTDQVPWKRIIVLIAGATMNYILALFLIVLMFACIGRPMYKVVEKMPLETEETAILQQTGEGLLVGDVIKKVDGKNVYMITDYMDILNGRKQGDVVPILVLRGAEEITVDMILRVDANIVNMSDTNTLLTAMGVNSMYAVTEREGFFPMIGHALVYSVKIGGTVLRSLGELLTGKLGLDSMGGPITTIQVTSQAASSGLMSFLNIATFIGVNLAVFNLLPIPALDGCKVIFCIIEWIRKKPVNRNVEAMIHFIGIIFLFGFAILVDLLQLF